MSSLEVTTLHTAVANVITRRAGSGADASAVAAATRRACDDLAVVLVPLISQAGVDALIDRAVHLAKREYPLGQAGEEEAAEPFDQVRLWLERQDPALAIGAATMMLATFATLLAALIGEPLTTRYLRKAWPDGFSDTTPESTKP
jgi:hypothetical protein